MPKPQQLFLRGEYIENETFLLNLPDIKVFFRIERILSKPFLKKTISIHGMHLHHLGDVLDKESARFNRASVPETYTGNDISKFTLLYFMSNMPLIICLALC